MSINTVFLAQLMVYIFKNPCRASLEPTLSPQLTEQMLLNFCDIMIPNRHNRVFNLRCSGRHYLDSSLGDADGLLLHGFVDGHLVLEVHLVELIDAAHALQKQRTLAVNTTEYTS